MAVEKRNPQQNLIIKMELGERVRVNDMICHDDTILFSSKKRKIRNAIMIWRLSRGILIQPSIIKLLLMKTFKKGISIISYLWFKARQNEPSKNVVSCNSYLLNVFVITSIKKRNLIKSTIQRWWMNTTQIIHFIWWNKQEIEVWIIT